MVPYLSVFVLLMALSYANSGHPVCDPGSVAATYTFPIPARSGECTVANIPSAFGAIEGNFEIHITAEFQSLDGPGYIIENGISGVVTGRIAFGVFRGSAITWLAGTPACTESCVIFDPTTSLQTSKIPLSIMTNIILRRSNRICSLIVNGSSVVTVSCTDSALIPSQSNGNTWSIFGVGAQKSDALSCGVNTFNSGTIAAITLTVGKS